MVIQLIVRFLNELDEKSFQQAIKDILILYVWGCVAEYFREFSHTNKACVLQFLMKEKSFYLVHGVFPAVDDAM